MSWSFLDFTGLSHFFSKLPEKLVTTDTTQTISGTKSFSSTIIGSVSGSAASAAKDGAGNVIADTYETKADAATHLSKSDAAGTYLSKTDAASAYVQTAAVDQTIAGTKTFSKPIVGSVTGSSGSCTGNAATATTATTAEACTGNAATATKLATARSLWGNSFDGSAAISGTITGTPSIEFKPTATTSNNGGFLDFHYNQSTADYTSRIIESASGTLSINNVTITTGKVVTATTFNGALKGNVTGNCSGSSGSCTGNAASATKLATARTINGTAFNGTADITTANWGTTCNIAIADATATNTGEAVSVDGSAAVTLKLPAAIKANVTGSLTGNAATATTATTAEACTGNAATATKLQTARTINGTGFDGTANITTDNWGTARNISITDGTNTSTAVSVNGSANVSLNLPATIKANLTGNCSGSSGSCTGNAATATKLATARTIALSGAATGTATGFDGSGNIEIPVTALSPSAIRAQWYAAYPDGAEAHNAMWGGRDITAAFDSGEFSEHVADGTFKDIFPGDYITKQVTISGTAYTVNWVITDCDYWINKGDTAMTAHHVAIVPQVPIFNANMNPTNTTEGGYAGSEMYKNVIPACATGIVNAFGSDHILTFRDGITNSVDTSHVSSGVPQWTGTPGWWGTWVSVQCNLMSEKMVYGAPVCAAGAMDNTMATRQMSAFRLSERLINYNRQTWWLRDVVSSAFFARVYGGGFASLNYASAVHSVRPFALLV